MRAKRIVIIQLVVFLYVTSVPSVTAKDWSLIGSAFVTRKIATRTVFVNSKHRRVTRLKLKALNATIKVWSMTIYFRNGKAQVVSLDQMIPHNNESREIDLEESGGIRRIVLSLNAVTFRKKNAVLWIYGT